MLLLCLCTERKNHFPVGERACFRRTCISENVVGNNADVEREKTDMQDKWINKTFLYYTALQSPQGDVKKKNSFMRVIYSRTSDFIFSWNWKLPVKLWFYIHLYIQLCTNWDIPVYMFEKIALKIFKNVKVVSKFGNEVVLWHSNNLVLSNFLISSHQFIAYIHYWP